MLVTAYVIHSVRMSLPSYQEATTRPDPWILIAPMLPSILLSNLCLVSKHFYEVFAPLLWFEPTKVLLRNTNPLGPPRYPTNKYLADNR